MEAFVADWYASVYLGVRVDYRAGLLPRGGIEDVGGLDELDYYYYPTLSLGGGEWEVITTAWSIAGRI